MKKRISSFTKQLKDFSMKFWVSNYLEILLMVGLAFIIAATTLLSYIAAMYLIGVILIAFAVVFKIWGGR